MNTVGYLFIIVALFLIRGITKGRTLMQLPTDLGDAFTAIISGDPAKLAEVTARVGDPPTNAGEASTASSVTAARESGTPTTSKAAKALAYARAQIGKPYIWAATGPNGYDCSGLTSKAWAAAGVTIHRNTLGQITDGRNIARADLAIGDLVFPNPGHVSMYAGNGNVVEAAKPGTLIREVPIWGFWAARRIEVVTSQPVQANGTGVRGLRIVE